MSFNFNQSILVTGASSAIGREVAAHLALLGFTVLAAVVNEADGEAVHSRLPARIKPLGPFTMGNTEDVKSAGHYIHYEVTSKKLPPLYGVINIADGGHIAPLELARIADIKEEFEKRVLGPISLLQQLIPLLRETKGRIVWIAAPGLFPVSFMSDIHGPDFSVNYLARTLDLELLPDGIRNILIRCACIEISSAQEMRETLGERMEAETSGVTMNRYRSRLMHLSSALEIFENKKSDPAEIVRAIEAALLSPRPKTRYQVGSMAKSFGLLEKLPQSWVDLLLKRKEKRTLRQWEENAAGVL